MNERIKELYEQAHLVYEIPYESSVVDSTIVSTYKRRQFDAEKFAELIVRECLSIMVDERQRQLGEFYHSNPNGTAQDFIGMSGAIFTVDRIKQHFGVEE